MDKAMSLDGGPSSPPRGAVRVPGIFSEWGTYPSWSQYLDQTVEKHITFSQHNVFRSNTYHGPWSFMALQQGDMVSWRQWRSSPYRQDEGSTLKVAS
jgi:hypothetical protein